MLGALPYRRAWQGAVTAATIACFVPVLTAYPYFFPFVNSLAMGTPGYALLNDSNVSWNEALPEVERFASEQHLAEIGLDWASLSDPAIVVPEAKMWDCQTPADSDAGHWVAVAAGALRENHNCAYLEPYPHRTLAGGSFYVFQLPARIPAVGSPGGLPAPASRRNMWGVPFDMRGWAVNVERHPDQLSEQLQVLTKAFQRK